MASHLGKQTLSGGIAHLNVGPEETPFDVHLELLCDCSDYFNSLLHHRTISSVAEGPICFPEDDPDVFAEVIQWIPRLPPRLLLLDTWVQRVPQKRYLAAKSEFPHSFLEDIAGALMARVESGDHGYPEERYYVHTPLRIEEGEKEDEKVQHELLLEAPEGSDAPQGETPEQIRNRKIKTLTLWAREHSRTSTPDMITADSPAGSRGPSSGVEEIMKYLKIDHDGA